MTEPELTFSANGHDYSQPLALICFSATWCGPCEHMPPIYKELAEEYAGQLRVLKVDVDLQAELSREFSVNEVPTQVLLGKGRELARQVGAFPLEQLSQWVKRNLRQELEKKHEE